MYNMNLCIGKHIPLFYRMLCVAMAICIFAGCIADERPSHEESTYVHVGEPAPDFSTTLLDGSSRTLSSLRGEVVMLIFFSSSCTDCQAQFSEMMRLAKDLPPSFHILAISRAEDREQTESFSERYAWPFEMGLDPDDAIYSRYASMYVPRTFLIDAAGKVCALDVEFNPDQIQRMWQQANEMAE